MQSDEMAESFLAEAEFVALRAPSSFAGDRPKKGGPGVRYDLSAQVIDMADLGVPQHRERLIVIGIRRDLGVRPPTIPTLYAGNPITVREALDANPLRKRGRLRGGRVSKSMVQVTSVRNSGHGWRFLTLGQIADELAVSESQAYALVRSGDLVGIQIQARRTGFRRCGKPSNAYVSHSRSRVSTFTSPPSSTDSSGIRP